MKITDVAAAQIPLAHTSERSGKKAEGGLPDQRASSADVLSPSPDRIFYSRLEGANAEIQGVAQRIRAADDTMTRVETHVQQMTAALERILKSYPPYPVGSTERVEELRQFSSLRRMIDQLTLPPPEDSQEQFPTDKENAPAMINPQPMHTGPDGLDIPDLPSDASNGQIQKAHDKLTAAHNTLQVRRSAFVADANRVISSLA